MKNLSLRLKLQLPTRPSPLFVKPIKGKVVVSYGKNLKHPPSKFAVTLREQTPTPPITLNHTTAVEDADAPPAPRTPSMKLQLPLPLPLPALENQNSRIVIMGAVSVGILLLLSGMDDQKALALGPEGPLVEEFWDNVRRYALYALTVSTGAIYTILLPIFELLKNPITAILVLAIFGGSFYIVSQVLSAMFGVSDFTYDYNY